MKKKEGFTLIELMIVVAIIGILAAIAIPNFLKFQLRSKAGEGKLNLSGIRTAQESYFAETGTFMAWASNPNPAGTLFSQKQQWGVVCAVPPVPGVDPGFCFIGWEPEGDVYYNYQVNTNAALPLPSNQFWAAGESDIDGDATINSWGINKPDIAGNAMAAGPYGCNNVLNKQTNLAMMHQVGPCNNMDNGLNVF
jgi:type IV pilus assembly protein PilA